MSFTKIDFQRRREAKAALLEHADDFFHSRIQVHVPYETLREYGVLEDWMILRGLSELAGDSDCVTIGQAISLGLIDSLES